MRKKVLLSWSSGKDSAWALHLLRQRSDLEVTGLFTTINREFGRVAMHGVRLELLRQQAAAANLPLRLIPLPNPCPNVEYESIMGEFVEEALGGGITGIAFGDLFLEDIRAYREERLKGTGLSTVFPLWGRDTRGLASEMISGGLRGVVTCVDPRKIPASFAGREFSSSFLEDLPPGVDPCGENGEFHSFATAGPMFNHPVPVRPGEVLERDGFVFADFLPGLNREGRTPV